MTELNHPLQFTKLLHHHNAYRADSPDWNRTSNHKVNSFVLCLIELQGIVYLFFFGSFKVEFIIPLLHLINNCLLYTSDAADE